MSENKRLLKSFLCFFIMSLIYVAIFWLLRVSSGGEGLMATVHCNVGFSMLIVSAIGTFGLSASYPITPKLLVASKVLLPLSLIAAISFLIFTNVIFAFLALTGVVWILCSITISLTGLFYKEGYYWTFVILQILWGIYTFASFALACEISASC